MLRRQPRDLMVTMAIAASAMLLALSDVNPAVPRVIFELLLVLILPGYAITAAVFGQRTLPLRERVMFSLGTSLALAAVSGLVLNVTPWGLQATSWAVLLGSITMVASLFALARGHRIDITPVTRPPHAEPNAREGLLLGAAALITLAAFVVARMPTPAQGLQGYTLLTIAPVDGSQSTLRLGVASKEFSTTQYRLEFRANGRTIQQWKSITLAPNETWQDTVALPDSDLSAQPLTARLFRLDDSKGSVYRYVEWRPQK